ncbi:AraC family transcriptional regulator [Actinoplanes cyaneus]|uniref:AraC family transcriptional regulator n=1 Tax=Actinoplanes cyaneus TaxID=52696 RepID=A0A919M610_9ACTN|nr:AraC family transcriptional regulator [Actinoplanes cyaneus]MCW2141173.1 transcriptional regulator, AraC family [Actinoplanes cyaneus]GID67237.1 AraC family transcriptional regulator [Actinoplanes cyaneus]
MDLVADVLEISGVRGTIGARIEAGENWSVPVVGCTAAVLYVVAAGGAWLTLRDRPTSSLELATGDVVLMPAGPPHVLSSSPRTDTPFTDPAAAARAYEAGEVIHLGSPPTRTRILTISYECDHTVRTQVIDALPEVVHVRADQGETGFDDTVRMLGRELSHPRLAGRAVLNSLVDILLVQVMRAWLPTRPGHQGTWLGVLGDPLVHSAVERLHAEPARPWTTATLASTLAVSRATLSRRFPAAVGQSPGAYLTQWRMDLAAVRLRKTQDPIESIATAVGYQSVPAFSRAFARSHGTTPGRFRTTVKRHEGRQEIWRPSSSG